MIMDREKPIAISLTSTNSHLFKIPLGQGSFSIGSVGMDKKKFDVLVEEDLLINWNAFDEFTTPSGGHWPRFFYYWGKSNAIIRCPPTSITLHLFVIKKALIGSLRCKPVFFV